MVDHGGHKTTAFVRFRHKLDSGGREWRRVTRTLNPWVADSRPRSARGEVQPCGQCENAESGSTHCRGGLGLGLARMALVSDERRDHLRGSRRPAILQQLQLRQMTVRLFAWFPPQPLLRHQAESDQRGQVRAFSPSAAGPTGRGPWPPSSRPRSSALVCWWTAAHGGKVVGSIRHGEPARTIQRRALKTPRRSCRRCAGRPGSSRVEQDQVLDDERPLLVSHIGPVRIADLHAAHLRQVHDTLSASAT